MSANDYDKYEPAEHVRERPDTYIGDIEVLEEARWVYKESEKRMVKKQITYNPGLEHCVVELIVNATDRTQDPNNGVTKIDVSITNDTIKIFNDGISIPIEIHEKHGIYVPELIFGNMLSGGNFKKGVKRTVGGKNGIGAKAANIFSTRFVVTVVNKGKKYIQIFEDQMKKKSKPKITKVKAKDSVTIEYTPALRVFGMTTLNCNDTPLLIEKRTIDASAVTPKSVAVSFDGKKITTKHFEDYINLFIGKKSECNRVYCESDRWSVGFALNPFPNATQISFVNGVCTEDGGTHVNHVLEPVLNRVVKEIQEKNKDLNIKKSYIRDNIIVFVKSIIEDPKFTSQTKRQHTTRPLNFGSRLQLSDDTIKKIVKLGISKGIAEIARAKDMKELKKSDGKKVTKLLDIEKLNDANKAGGARSSECTLILTEGDSAKATAIAGISVVGKDLYGVFPLKGKLLNVKGASDNKIANNEEITNIKRILGLAQGMKDKSKLRYGKIMIMADQDTDGHHIKGLVINWLTTFWPELVSKQFVCSLLTPIVKVFKGDRVKSFYNVQDYEKWKNRTNGSSSWRVKYYKGLGTSSSKEAKEYFANLTQNKVEYTYDHKKKSEDNINLELAFSDSKKTNTDLRKEWITETMKLVDKQTKTGKPIVDYNQKIVPVKTFVKGELALHSLYDNQRSLPHFMDGLKPSQRKILFSSLKRNLFTKPKEIKVAQLSGYVSEHAGYHHGEASLQGAIVNMAQDFIGSGNINLLFPSGQFGTRIKGGKDASSARYIFTYLNDIVKTIFDVNDNKLLNYLEDDGSPIEPDFYVPTIPMLLVNGAEGIGTGWSTNIPCYNPKDIINNLKRLIEDEESEIVSMDPWYKGFTGTIEKKDQNTWISTGVIKRLKPRNSYQDIEILELPVGVWTDDYKLFLNKLEQKEDILDCKDYSTDEKVKFVVTFKKLYLSKTSDKDIIKLLKLTKNIKDSNMHAFQCDGTVKKYECAEEILWDFYEYRKSFYVKRKEYIDLTLSNELKLLTEKLRFIKMVMDSQILVFRRKKSDIITDIESNNFEKIKDSYNHLLEIKIHAFTEDKLNELQSKIGTLTQELDILRSKSSNDLWLEDLNNF
jgi:DNA topoisomerase II